jgi:hypothetical protein
MCRWVRSDPDWHLELWRDLTRRAEERYVAAPASLLAYTAFMTGDGALANLALDRAQHANPDYSMAGLLREVIQTGLRRGRSLAVRLMRISFGLWVDGRGSVRPAR